MGVGIPDACVGIFKGGKIVKTTSTKSSGEFKLNELPHGSYVLIVRYRPFCTANIPINISKKKGAWKIKKRGILITMVPAGIDTCSGGDYRK